jgi:phospholipase C
MGCSTAIADDPHLGARLACTFTAGAMPADTLAVPPSIPIQHVIVVMKENRSFDHLFGALGAVQPDAETFPAGFTNPDPHGAAVAPFHLHRLERRHRWVDHARPRQREPVGHVAARVGRVGRLVPRRGRLHVGRLRRVHGPVT